MQMQEQEIAISPSGFRTPHLQHALLLGFWLSGTEMGCAHTKQGVIAPPHAWQPKACAAVILTGLIPFRDSCSMWMAHHPPPQSSRNLLQKNSLDSKLRRY